MADAFSTARGVAEGVEAKGGVEAVRSGVWRVEIDLGGEVGEGVVAGPVFRGGVEPPARALPPECGADDHAVYVEEGGEVPAEPSDVRIGAAGCVCVGEEDGVAVSRDQGKVAVGYELLQSFAVERGGEVGDFAVELENAGEVFGAKGS